MKKLGVNIDHIATIRQARGTDYPDPVTAAGLAEAAGADQITIHLREDRRHIQDKDLVALRQAVRTHLNLELAASEEIVRIACEVCPDVATIVPEKRQELTTEGGLDVVNNFEQLKSCIRKLQEHSISVSLFIDPEIVQVEASHRLEVEAVEFHTGKYCDAPNVTIAAEELQKLKDAVRRAGELGLKICAGHGLNYDNTARVVREIPDIVEYNIGHSIVSRALFVGFERAVQEMNEIIKGATL